MNQLERLEALAQRLVEGTFHRFFRTSRESRSAAPITRDAQNGQGDVDTREISRFTAEKQAAARWRLSFAGRQITLGEPVFNIGRALDNDLVLSEPTVSRYHAQLRWRQGRYYLCSPPLPDRTTGAQPETKMLHPATSLPYTLLNEQPVGQEPQPLTAGDIIELGEVRLAVDIAPRRS